MSHDIAIITVVYKNYTVLQDFLRSLEHQRDTAFHLFIADASPEKLPIQTTVPNTIIPIENLGYAHGVNMCIKKAQELGIVRFCVMNNDTFMNDVFTQAVHAALNIHQGALIGGKIFYASGYEYHKERYSAEESGRVLWYAGGYVDWDHALTHHLGVDEADTGEYDNPEATDFITGCLMCFDQKVVEKIGLWDEHYFLYYEDADYCERAKHTGLPLWYEPAMQIWHKNAQSTDGSGSALHEKLQRKSQLRFALKYAPLRTKFHIVKNYFF